ncbi:hypothetical protein HMPREF9056_02025 [Actinomyces sp. oral taxon 170 str. F0386]|nr:hypothetical protein HMPREF9056_02025 [Actinomyces sp. oral taxon 170 str. F0386]
MSLQVRVDRFGTLRVCNIKNKKMCHDDIIALTDVQGEILYE